MCVKTKNHSPLVVVTIRWWMCTDEQPSEASLKSSPIMTRTTFLFRNKSSFVLWINQKILIARHCFLLYLKRKIRIDKINKYFLSDFNIPTMILIEVIELIIDVDGTFHLLWNLKNVRWMCTFRNKHYQKWRVINITFKGK